MSEDRRLAQRLEDREEARRARDLTDRILETRADIVGEARILRHLETTGHIDDHPWWESKYRLSDLTDRLNGLEGDTA